MEEHTTVIPALRYNDPEAGMAWLERALGFTQHAVYRDPESSRVMHAELVHRHRGGVGMVMLGSTETASEMSSYYRQPGEAGGVTAAVYLVVDDCEPVYQAAKDACAEVVMELRTMDYGGKAFTLRDPEGHVWSLGEYDPFALLKG